MPHSDRPVKCPICEKYFRRSEEEFVYNKKDGRHYHRECYKTIERDLEDEEKLREYIKKIFNIEHPTPLMNRQIRQYVDEEGMTYSGIHGSLVYFLTVEKGKLEGLTLGIVPYVYDRAAAYFKERSEQRKKIEAYDGEAVTIKQITVKRPRRKGRRTLRKIIDLEEVE